MLRLCEEGWVVTVNKHRQLESELEGFRVFLSCGPLEGPEDQLLSAVFLVADNSQYLWWVHFSLVLEQMTAKSVT